MTSAAPTVAAAGHRRRTRIAALCILGLLLAVTAPSGAATGPRTATLTVSPRVYVGGQRVIFQGRLSQTGQRRITLQFHMNRPGDRWNDIEGFSAKTAADGSFRFAYHAPSMFNIRYRVVSGGLVTPGWKFDARSQDLTLHVAGPVVAGKRFPITVNTTPDLPRRPDLPPPAFPGRKLTLQKRVGSERWQTLDKTTTGPLGFGKFHVVAHSPGYVTYRVREGNYSRNGNRIGWFPSFPTYVHVRRPAGSGGRAATGVKPQGQAQQPVRVSPSSAVPVPAFRNTASTTASHRYGWGRSLWDFAWESGESLTSPPSRGTKPHGRWRDGSNGSGRASSHNGGLMLDSQRDNVDGPGDHGKTTATMRGNRMRYGRWEVRLRTTSTETNSQDYHAKIKLIPARARDRDCGAQNITVANVTAHHSAVKIGAKARNGTRWSRTVHNVPINGRALAFAVEVTRRHITWFREGQPIGTVRNAAAVSDVPMTLRLSLAGNGQHEMNRTQSISDWERGFTLEHGRHVTSGPSLRRSTFHAGCRAG